MANTETHSHSVTDVQDALLMIFDGCADDDLATNVVSQIVSNQGFDEAGLLTRDTGVVIRLANGSEFQITIVQSR